MSLRSYEASRLFQLMLLLMLFTQTALAAPFVVYDATLYKGKPDMQTAGLIPLPVIYEGNADPIWVKTDRSKLPSKSSVMKEVKRLAQGHDLICLDYESWPLTSTMINLDDPMSKLLTILQWTREAAPNVKIGFYGVPPISDYWGAVSGRTSNKAIAWLNASAKLAPLAKQVDVIFPSLYTFYTNQEEWEVYAISQITQAKTYGKPVYVFLWPQYHDSNFLLGTRYIPRDYWKRQLEVALKNADGIVIWGGWDIKNNRQAKWDENAEWWHETKAFLAKINTISSPPAAPTIQSKQSPPPQ